MGPAVIVDQTLLGEIQELTDIPLKDVQAVRYLAAWDATTRYGPGYANGVIEVTTWSGRRTLAPNSVDRAKTWGSTFLVPRLRGLRWFSAVLRGPCLGAKLWLEEC